MDKINSELLKGSATTVVLKMLQTRDRYGYEMVQEIETDSQGLLTLKEGALYPILHQLEKDGAIESYWQKGETARERRYYRITKAGKRILEKKTREWHSFKNLIDHLLAERRLSR